MRVCRKLVANCQKGVIGTERGGKRGSILHQFLVSASDKFSSISASIWIRHCLLDSVEQTLVQLESGYMNASKEQIHFFSDLKLK